MRIRKKKCRNIYIGWNGGWLLRRMVATLILTQHAKCKCQSMVSDKHVGCPFDFGGREREKAWLDAETWMWWWGWSHKTTLYIHTLDAKESSYKIK